MKVKWSEDAMGDGPDGVAAVMERLKDFQYNVTFEGNLVGRGLILKDVGYFDSESIYLSFVDFWGEFTDDYYIVLNPENGFGEDLVLEYS